MATRRVRRRPEPETRDERCVFCRLTERLSRDLEPYGGVLDHLGKARREVLEAVREFARVEISLLERRGRKRRTANARKAPRVTRIEVGG
jgi:hypothetical protein